MDWLRAIGESWLTTLAWVAGLAVVFGILGRRTPCNPGMFWWKDRRAAVTDFLYWFVVPLFLRIGRTVMLAAGLVLVFGGKEPNVLPVRQLPLWLQCPAILLLQDVLLYWLHRAFHTRAAWKFHAVHHSPKVLDWTATQRTHPVNYLLEFALADVVVLLLGFAPAALVVLAPFNIVFSALVHANLNWTFGPFRYLLASPVFHRWHHTTEAEGLDKNFASTFPFLDLLFGTFSMPAGRLPDTFGNGEPDYPESFWGQFLDPFRNRGRVLALTGGTLAVLGLAAGRLYFLTVPAAPVPVRPAVAMAPAVRVPPPARVPGQAVLAGHTGAVLAVAVSGDGTRVISGSEDGTVKVWDVATGREVFTLTGHGRPVCGVTLSPDGSRVISGGHDRTLRVWNAATGKPERALTGHEGPVYSVAVSADGYRIASAGWGAVKLWDAVTGVDLLDLPTGPGSVLGVAVSPDGRHVAAAVWETVRVWDAATGRVEFTLKGHAALVTGVAFSPDGRRLASASLDRTVKVWDAATGREVFALSGHTGPVHAVAFDPDGTQLVSGSGDGTVKVWDAATGKERRTLAGHTDAVTSVAVSGDGRTIVSGSRDGTVRVWGAPRAPGDLARRD
jgi:sterol desaturase/sphingolipid hydroxylase (fatty acid hydroxylase superfamily)